MWPLKKKSPQQLLEAQLLRQWQQSMRETNLQLLPLRLVLWYQCQSLEATEEAKRDRTGLPQGRRRPSKRIAIKMLGASATNVKRASAWLSRRRCLQPVRRLAIQLSRRAGLKLLTLLMRAYKLQLQSNGIPK